jgi:hypothetical protein
MEKLIYSVANHLREKSHEMRVFQNKEGVKIKMTYEAHNANERFTGEQFVNGKWEHTFSMLDLGQTPDTKIYVSSEGKREDRASKLFVLGIKLFNILNK